MGRYRPSTVFSTIVRDWPDRAGAASLTIAVVYASTLHVPYSDTMTNDPAKKRHLRLVTNEDLKRLIESRESGGFVTMLHPLELFMSRALLIELTRESMERIRTQAPNEQAPNEQLAVQRALQQRVDFLGWLAGQPEQVYMALYPAEMDGLDDLDELLDLPTDENDPQLPF